MKVFFVYSASYSDLLREADVRILINFATIGVRGERKIPVGFKDVIIDSGGYQLQVGTSLGIYSPNRLVEQDVRDLSYIGTRQIWKKKPDVNLYAMWLSMELPKHPEVSGFFNLDILGDGIESMENQFKLEKLGVRPIPIWHLGEGEEYLEYYCRNYDYIGVGGLIAGSTSKGSLKKLVTLLNQKYKGPKYHFLGIGITGASVFMEARPYSVDFSTWSNPARFGSHIVTDPKQILKEVGLPKEIRDRMRTDKGLTYKYLREAIALIKDMETSIEAVHTDTVQELML